jgi:hypothetical protein
VEISSVSCPNCGAPVAAARAGIVTCAHCSSQLEIKKDGLVVMSEISKDVRLIRLHKQLELLDLEWNKRGGDAGMAKRISIIFAVVGFLVFVFLVMPWKWGWISQMLVIGAIVLFIVYRVAKNKLKITREYNNRRANLLEELKKAEASG